MVVQETVTTFPEANQPNQESIFDNPDIGPVFGSLQFGNQGTFHHKEE